MKHVKTLVLAALPAVFAAAAQAQDDAARNSFYIGGGSADRGNALESDKTPFSIGFMHQPAGRKLIVGVDLGREGTLLDSTWGQNAAVSQATSYNLLVGGNLVETGSFRTDAVLLLGLREETSDCPESYLGFQCYADAAPDTSYKADLGAVITLSFDKVTLGLRATGEGTQMIAGMRC